MKNFLFLLIISTTPIFSQQTNVQNEIDTDNTQIFYFNHIAIADDLEGMDYFKPYLAYFKKTGNTYSPTDYLMDSFILLDFYYFYSYNSSTGEETPFKGIYEKKYLDSYLKDVFTRTKIPIRKNTSKGIDYDALIVANERSALAYTADNIPETATILKLKFNLKLESGILPNGISNDILIGWKFFDNNGNQHWGPPACTNEEKSDDLKMYYVYKDFSSINENFDLDICVPSSVFTDPFKFKFYIMNWNLDQESELKLDDVELLNGSTNLISPSWESNFNNTFDEQSTKWEFYKEFNYISKEFLFDNRDNLLSVIKDARNNLSLSINLPNTKIILTFPAINIDYYVDNNKIAELKTLIDYFIDEIDTKFSTWTMNNQNSGIEISGLYMLDEYIKGGKADDMEEVILHLNEKLETKNWKLYGSPYASGLDNTTCQVESSFDYENPDIIGMFDVVWQQPNAFFLSNSPGVPHERDRELLRMANSLASSRKININIENRVKDGSEPYGRINDYFDYGDKYGYINYSKVYYDDEGAHYHNCYSSIDEERIDYDNLYKFIKKARNGVIINSRFEIINESNTSLFHNWEGNYSIKNNSFSNSNERFLEVSVNSPIKVYSEAIPIKGLVDYRVDFKVKENGNGDNLPNSALVGVIFYDNNDVELMNLSLSESNLVEHYQGNYYIYFDTTTSFGDFNFYFESPSNAVKFKFYLEKWKTADLTFKNMKLAESNQNNQSRLIFKDNGNSLKLENKIKYGNYTLSLDYLKSAASSEKISVLSDVNYEFRISTKEVLPIENLSQQNKALVGIETFNTNGTKITPAISGFNYSSQLGMYYKYIDDIGQTWNDFSQNVNLPTGVASIKVHLYNWYYDNTILFDNISFEVSSLVIEEDTDNLFEKDKWNEKPPLIVSHQKPVFYNQFIDVSEYSSLTFSAMARDSHTQNGSNNDLLAIEFYDNTYQLLRNDDITGSTNFTWSTYYKYWWDGNNYFEIDTEKCYQPTGHDDRRWFHNQWEYVERTITIPTNAKYIRLSLHKLYEDSEHFLVLNPVLKGTTTKSKNKASSKILNNNNFLLDQDVLIYPNPSNQYVSILLEKEIEQAINYIVYDISGKKIKQGIVNKRTNIVDIRDLTSGVYIIKLYNEKITFNKRIIKK